MEILKIIILILVIIFIGFGINKLWRIIERKPIKEVKSTPLYITKVIK